MPRSIPEMIKGDFSCEDISKCILGLKDLDLEAYKVLLRKGPLSAEALGEALSRERSTAYRALQNLINCGLVYRETRTILGGGYYYEYAALEPARMKSLLRENIELWYRKMLEMVEEIDKVLAEVAGPGEG